MRLRITKACAPISAVQGTCTVKVHGPWNVIEIIEIRRVVIAHGLGLFFYLNLEETGACPEWFKSGGDDNRPLYSQLGKINGATIDYKVIDEDYLFDKGRIDANTEKNKRLRTGLQEGDEIHAAKEGGHYNQGSGACPGCGNRGLFRYCRDRF